jgi:hypothetical protein
MGLAKAQYAAGYFTEVCTFSAFTHSKPPPMLARFQRFHLESSTERAELTTSQTGIGTEPDLGEAMMWYKKASEGGDKRAQKRLAGGGGSKTGGSGALDRRLEMEAMKEEHKGGGAKGDNCVVM